MAQQRGQPKAAAADDITAGAAAAPLALLLSLFSASGHCSSHLSAKLAHLISVCRPTDHPRNSSGQQRTHHRVHPLQR